MQQFLNRGRLNWQTPETIGSSTSEDEVSCCQDRRGFIIGYNHSDSCRSKEMCECEVSYLLNNLKDMLYI